MVADCAGEILALACVKHQINGDFSDSLFCEVSVSVFLVTSIYVNLSGQNLRSASVIRKTDVHEQFCSRLSFRSSSAPASSCISLHALPCLSWPGFMRTFLSITVQKREMASYARLETVVRLCVEQNGKDSQVLDVTKASHCTGSVSSALTSGDAGNRTQVWTDKTSEESTAAPTRISVQSAGQGEKSGPTAGGKEPTHSG